MPILPLKAELLGFALGLRTIGDMKDALGDAFRGESFSVDDLADIDALAAKITTGTTSHRLEFAARLEWALMAAENGQITEAAFRSALEI